MSQKNKIIKTSLNLNKFVSFLRFNKKRQVLQNIKNFMKECKIKKLIHDNAD